MLHLIFRQIRPEKHDPHRDDMERDLETSHKEAFFATSIEAESRVGGAEQ